MTPVVLVKSFDASTTATDLISTILKGNGETPKKEFTIVAETAYESYACHIKTKYFETSVSLVPYTGELLQVPTQLLERTEAFIAYTKGDNRSVLELLSSFSESLASHRIELNILLTDKLGEDAALGLTYKEVKSIANVVYDVIELSVENYDDDDDDWDNDSDNRRDVVLEALRNHIWSTVKVPSQLDDDDDDFDSDAESQIQAFESLLNNLQNFKKVSSTLDREQVLDQAEKLADLFANIMNED